MTIDLLIQCIVRQTTVLIAQLATTGGLRAPLAQLADQVFLDLVDELERQGVGRKVGADMFGMGLRTYQRKIQRLTESATDRGQSLWSAVLAHIAASKFATRADIRERFATDDEALLRGILRDLCDSGLVFSSGQGAGTVYRASSEEELQAFRQLRSRDGLEELLWAIIYRQGPLSSEGLAALGHFDATEVDSALTRLLAANRIELSTDSGIPLYKASSLFIAVGANSGWEAAVFDHFQAMVKTICRRLRNEPGPAGTKDTNGGSTYTLEVWPGHPCEQETFATLSRLRAMVVELRQRVEEYNASHEIPPRHDQVFLYVGQCVIPQGCEDEE